MSSFLCSSSSCPFNERKLFFFIIVWGFSLHFCFFPLLSNSFFSLRKFFIVLCISSGIYNLIMIRYLLLSLVLDFSFSISSRGRFQSAVNIAQRANWLLLRGNLQNRTSSMSSQRSKLKTYAEILNIWLKREWNSSTYERQRIVNENLILKAQREF